MVNWQITATTIYCDSVADEVTVMVHKDGSLRCTGQQKYGSTSGNGKKPSGGRPCPGAGDCPQVSAYRDKLFAEEARQGEGKSQP